MSEVVYDHEHDYEDPVVRFQDPLFASSDREVLVEKIEEAQHCAIVARQECSALQQRLSDLQARYQQLKDKSTAKIGELKSTADRERSRRKQLTTELLTDKQRSAQLAKHCSKLKKECLRTIAESEQRVQDMHTNYTYVIERYEQRLHSAAQQIVNMEAAVNGHTSLSAAIVDYSNDVQAEQQRIACEIDAKKSEIDATIRRIRSCGGELQEPDAFETVLSQKDHVIGLLQRQVQQLQKLSALQYEALARIPRAATSSPPDRLHVFGNIEPQKRRPLRHPPHIESCTDSDP